MKNVKKTTNNGSFKSIGELIDLLKRGSIGKSTVWFRGQSVAKWKLQPSIMRPPHSFDDEVVLLKRFKQNAVSLMDAVPTSEADWLFLMQHHDVPTRLLDWTESPLVSLYFAVGPSGDSKHDSEDAALWCLFPHSLNHMVGVRMDSTHDIPSFGHEDVLDGYLPSRAAGIKSASPKPIALIAPRPFRRLHVQQGVFTLFHRNPIPLEEIVDDYGKSPHIVKFIIPASAKPKLRQELQLLQIDRLALFPELENVAARILILKK
ncbi:MAG: FRG domain-containing protein [Verrucomicrobia bacterium]|nr:FRG domain-containing protein [Verrucomicrobiota bacterium]